MRRRRRTIIAGLAAIVAASLAPAAVAEGPRSTQSLRGDLTRMLEELRTELEGLGLHWESDRFGLAPGPERPLVSFMLRHREDLDLSDEQVRRLEGLRRDFEREAIRRGADLRVAEMDVAALLDADPVDLRQVEAKVREIERLRADLRMARIRTIEQGKAQLTPEQRIRLRSLLRDDA